MNARTAYARLASLEVPVVSTAEAATLWGVTQGAASKTLRRLSDSGLLVRVRQGLFWIGPKPVDLLLLPDYLTRPFPAYVSLYSALYRHGVLSQIPSTLYVVSLARAQRIRTSLGEVSVHHVAPEVFGGYDTLPGGPKLATVEKALFDLAYLAGGRSRLFASPPELELPPRLDRRALQRWTRKISHPRLREQVEAQLEKLG